MSNINCAESSEIEIVQNVYKPETDQENNEKSSNNERNSDNLNETDEVLVAIDDNKKGDDKSNANGRKKNFVVYGYYVREPIWVNFKVGEDGVGGGSYDPKSRNPFISLVFLIVFTMLVATAGWAGLSINLNVIRSMYRSYGLFILIAAAVIMLSLSYAMACSRCTRVIPCNIICLVFAVIGMSLIVGFFTIIYQTKLIIFSVIATAAVVFVCFLLACTKFDFTKWLLYVIVIGVVIGVLGLCVFLAKVITGESWPIFTLVILVAATLLHTVMLTIEIQTILGGKAVELEENDYAFGAYMIYTSVIDLFLKLLQIFGILDSF